MNEILKRQFAEIPMRNAYAKIAWFYNTWSWLTESGAAKTALDFAAIRNGERILEVAVGTGLVFAKIVQLNKEGLSDGIDLSESMLRRAERLAKRFPTERYHLQVGSAYKLPFASQTFDLVMNNFMFDLLPEEDFIAVLSEFRRVLKSNGRIVLSTMTFGKRWYNRIWHVVAAHFPYLLTGCRPVSLVPFLKLAGVDSIQTKYVSQNTLPSEVVKAEVSGNLGRRL